MNMKFEHADAKKALKTCLRANNSVKGLAKMTMSEDFKWLFFCLMPIIQDKNISC